MVDAVSLQNGGGSPIGIVWASFDGFDFLQ